jgi:transcriptional regulator with XRE-family HTH domain
VPTVTEIIQALQAAGLRQADIARRAQIPQSRLSRWEAGAVPVSADDALRLMSLFEDVGRVAPGRNTLGQTAATESTEQPRTGERRVEPSPEAEGVVELTALPGPREERRQGDRRGEGERDAA